MLKPDVKQQIKSQLNVWFDHQQNKVPNTRHLCISCWGGEVLAHVMCSFGMHGFISATITYEHCDGPMDVHVYNGYDRNLKGDTMYDTAQMCFEWMAEHVANACFTWNTELTDELKYRFS